MAPDSRKGLRAEGKLLNSGWPSEHNSESTNLNSDELTSDEDSETPIF